MYQHDKKYDAHKLSNSKEKWVNQITDVIVDVSVVGVKPETVAGIINCMRNGIDFVLYCNGSVVCFNPNDLSSYHSECKKFAKYESLHQMMMIVKLSLLEHTQLMIPVSVSKLKKVK